MAMLDMEKLLRNAAGQFAHDVGAKLRGPKNNANGFAKTPANTFNDARKQLPRDRPCGIFVYVESASLDDEPMNSLVRQTVANFFRSSKRVNIVALLSETLEIRNGKTAVVRNAYQLRLRKQLSKLDVLILDELGYVPASKIGSELLCDVISSAYECQSLIVTTNLPFENWTEVLSSLRLTGATLDRLTHRCHILEASGQSYRLRDAKRRKQTTDSSGTDAKSK